MGKSHWGSVLVAVACFSLAMGLSALAGPARPLLLRALRQQTNKFKCDIKIKPVDCPNTFSTTEKFSMTFRVTETGEPECLPAPVIVQPSLQVGTPPVVTSSPIKVGSGNLTEPGLGFINEQRRFSEGYLFEINNKGTRRILVNGAFVDVGYDFTDPTIQELVIQIDAFDGGGGKDRKIERSKPGKPKK